MKRIVPNMNSGMVYREYVAVDDGSVFVYNDPANIVSSNQTEDEAQKLTLFQKRRMNKKIK